MNNTQWVEITAITKDECSIITVGGMGFEKAVQEIERQLSKAGRKFQKAQWEKGGKKCIANNDFAQIFTVT